MTGADLQAFVHISSLLWLRTAPLLLLAPYLALGAVRWLWGAALSWALAGSLTPIVLQGCQAQPTCAAVLGSGLSWPAALYELVVGLIIALGVGLPLAAFRVLGAIAQGLGAAASLGSSMNASNSSLGRAAGLMALTAAALSGALRGLAQLLLRLPPPLGAARQPLSELCLSLADQLVRAFALGVSLSAPLLLAIVIVSAVLGLAGRIGGSRLLPFGSLLLPWLGLALVSLCVANWLDVLPGIVRSFAHSSARLLGGLP